MLQRLAVQGAEIDARDVILGSKKEPSNDEWSVIDLKDDKCSANQEIPTSKNNRKQSSSAVKKMKGAVSAFGFVSPNKNRNISIATDERNKLGCSNENAFWNDQLHEKESDSKSILMVESLPEKQSLGSDKVKRKPFRTIFQREQEKHSDGGNNSFPDFEEKEKDKTGKRVWVFDGFKKWKKNDSEDETDSFWLNEKRDGVSYEGKLVSNPIGEGPDTKQIKRKLHPNCAPTDFFVDKVKSLNVAS